MKARTGVLLVAGLVAAACGDAVVTEVPAGRWGGQNIELQVEGDGAKVLFKCGASGTLVGRLELNGSGHFVADGTYTPLLINTGPRPAHYEGSISGDGMTLAVTTSGAGSVEIGEFQLHYRAAGSFEVCNF